jgi:hypothetical protein
VRGFKTAASGKPVDDNPELHEKVLVLVKELETPNVAERISVSEFTGLISSLMDEWEEVEVTSLLKSLSQFIDTIGEAIKESFDELLIAFRLKEFFSTNESIRTLAGLFQRGIEQIEQTSSFEREEIDFITDNIRKLLHTKTDVTQDGEETTSIMSEAECIGTLKRMTGEFGIEKMRRVLQLLTSDVQGEVPDSEQSNHEAHCDEADSDFVLTFRTLLSEIFDILDTKGGMVSQKDIHSSLELLEYKDNSSEIQARFDVITPVTKKQFIDCFLPQLNPLKGNEHKELLDRFLEGAKKTRDMLDSVQKKRAVSQEDVLTEIVSLTQRIDLSIEEMSRKVLEKTCVFLADFHEDIVGHVWMHDNEISAEDASEEAAPAVRKEAKPYLQCQVAYPPTSPRLREKIYDPKSSVQKSTAALERNSSPRQGKFLFEDAEKDKVNVILTTLNYSKVADVNTSQAIDCRSLALGKLSSESKDMGVFEISRVCHAQTPLQEFTDEDTGFVLVSRQTYFPSLFIIIDNNTTWLPATESYQSLK